MDAAGGREQAAGPEDVEPGLQSRRYQGWPELKFRATRSIPADTGRVIAFYPCSQIPARLPPWSSSASRSRRARAQSPEPVNTLTPTEKSAGWTLLFDGKSTSAWRGYKKPDMAGLRWKVEDGCLALPAGEGADTRGQRDIITTQQFDDFELAWEWRIAKGGNSGVKYFVTENNESAIGHEYQVIDGAHPDAGLREGRRQTAAFYDVLAAPGATPFPTPGLQQGARGGEGQSRRALAERRQGARVQARHGHAARRHR